VDVIKKVWHALPVPVQHKVRSRLAALDIGRIRVRDANLASVEEQLRTAQAELAAVDHRLDDLTVVLDAPTEMSEDERLFLYALVRGTKPERVLEIGTSRGGSAAVFAAALEANGKGIVVGIDPLPRIEVPDEQFHGRFHLVTGESPGAVAEALEIAGGPFDLVLIDGMHIYQQTADDLAGALPAMADQAYVLFHDSFHFGVSEAIREGIEREPSLVDCGYVCNEPRRVGDLLTHAGFRLLRRGAPTVDMEAIVKPVWDEVDLRPPHDLDLRNHDIYYCEYVERCAYCLRTRDPLPAG
jgi:predicted O-methyltransferase YrrM